MVAATGPLRKGDPDVAAVSSITAGQVYKKILNYWGYCRKVLRADVVGLGRPACAQCKATRRWGASGEELKSLLPLDEFDLEELGPLLAGDE